MNTATETTTKKNGTSKATTTKPAVEKPAKEKTKTPQIVEGKENAWALARKLFDEGKKEKEVRTSVTEWLVKNTPKETALSFYAMRIGYRACRRAKAQFAAAAKKAEKAAKQ